MAKSLVKKGSTSRIEYLWISDSGSAVGAGKPAIAFNAAGLTAYYVRRGASPTSITLATQTVTGAFSSGGFVEVDATNMPGLYRFDPPDAAFATGVNKVIFLLKGASGMAPVVLEYQLVDFDPESATDLGLSKFADIETDTQDIQSRIPAALVSGRIDAYVGAMAANVLTAAAINADAFTAAKFASDVTTEFQNGLATATSVGTLQTSVDDLPTNAELSTALAGADDAVLAQVALVKAKTDNLPSDPADASDIASAFGVIGSAISGLAIPTAADVADAVWDETLAGHAGAGSTGEALAAAAGGGTAPTATEIADAVLRRQFDDVDDTGGTRDLLAAGRMIRNGFNPIVGTDLEVLKEDDTTVAWTRTLTTDPAAEPIVGVGGP